MNYNLVKSSNTDIEKLIEYKKQTIFEYIEELSEYEINKINNYINSSIPTLIDHYHNIVIDGNIVGCLLLTDEDNGVLLNEIYLEKEYRNKGIGSDIIRSIMKDNDIIYLWVYKLNVNAISLYKKLGFFIIEETETRYYMKYKK